MYFILFIYTHSKQWYCSSGRTSQFIDKAWSTPSWDTAMKMVQSLQIDMHRNPSNYTDVVKIEYVKG